MYDHYTHSEIIDIHHIYARKLNNHRTIRVYLPPSYKHQPDRRFPVLYTHDGQNMFHGQFSYSGASWEIHRVADDLIYKKMIEEIIIVAIDNMHSERLSEYAHENGSYQGRPLKGTGKLYEDFLIHDLKPFIDANFRTLTDAGNTALMGSSMGGLVTYNMGIRNPEIFGKLAILSPSFWWGDGVTLSKLKRKKLKRLNEKIWIDMGDAEGEFMLHCREVVQELLNKGYRTPDNLAYYSVPGANHSETAWALRVYCPLLYFFGHIGYPQEMHLHGRDIVGIRGPQVRLNPVIYFNTGFRMTALRSTYSIENSELLDINAMGDVAAKQVGETHVSVESLGVEVVKKMVVVEELSRTVTVTIHAMVPADTPDEPIYIGILDAQDFELEKSADGMYVTQIMLPRDEAISFKFTRGSWRTVEKNHQGGEIDSRILRAADDLTLYYQVENWAD